MGQRYSIFSLFSRKTLPMCLLDFSCNFPYASLMANLQLDESFAKQKKDIELSLARTMLTFIEKGTYTYEQSQEIARFILREIGLAKTPEQVLSFLEKLTLKWPVFENLRGLYRIKVKDVANSRKRMGEVSQSLASLV